MRYLRSSAAFNLQPPASNLQLLTSRNGQALVELAIFGTMALVVMGSLISFGMNADYQQRTQMRAIRDAMWSGIRARIDQQGVDVPDSETYVHMDSGFIPDPTDPFGMGAPTFANGSESSPMRHFKIGRAPDLNDVRELPRIVYKVDGQWWDCPSATILNYQKGLSPSHPYAIHGCTAAGFRNVNGVAGFQRVDDDPSNPRFVNNPDTIGPIDKYDFIYGMSSIRVIRSSVSCPTPPDNCTANVQITDPNEGEIVSKQSAIAVCRQILDQNACQVQCRRGKKPTQEAQDACRNICAQPMDVPRYCSASTPPTYLNPAFARFFDRIQNLGFQPIKSHAGIHETTMAKGEDAGGITSLDHISRWADLSSRDFVYIERWQFMVPTGTAGTRFTLPKDFFHKDVRDNTTVRRTPHQ